MDEQLVFSIDENGQAVIDPASARRVNIAMLESIKAMLGKIESAKAEIENDKNELSRIKNRGQFKAKRKYKENAAKTLKDKLEAEKLAAAKAKNKKLNGVFLVICCVLHLLACVFFASESDFDTSALPLVASLLAGVIFWLIQASVNSKAIEKKGVGVTAAGYSLAAVTFVITAACVAAVTFVPDPEIIPGFLSSILFCLCSTAVPIFAGKSAAKKLKLSQSELDDIAKAERTDKKAKVMNAEYIENQKLLWEQEGEGAVPLLEERISVNEASVSELERDIRCVFPLLGDDIIFSEKALDTLIGYFDGGRADFMWEALDLYAQKLKRAQDRASKTAIDNIERIRQSMEREGLMERERELLSDARMRGAVMDKKYEEFNRILRDMQS